MEVDYFSEDPHPPIIYEIPTSNFLPTFFTRRIKLIGGDEFNEEDLFEWKFVTFSPDSSGEVVPVVNCAGLIESFTDLKDDEKKSMNDALV